MMTGDVPFRGSAAVSQRLLPLLTKQVFNDADMVRERRVCGADLRIIAVDKYTAGADDVSEHLIAHLR